MKEPSPFAYEGHNVKEPSPFAYGGYGTKVTLSLVPKIAKVPQLTPKTSMKRSATRPLSLLKYYESASREIEG